MPQTQLLPAALQDVHAEDVSRARALIDQAVAEADAQWVPRKATMQALLGVLQDLSRPSAAPRADA